MEEFIPTRGTIGWEGWHTGRSHPAIGRVYSYNNISCTENPARDNIQHWTLNLGSWTRGEGNEHTLCVLVTTETCCGGSVWGGVEPSLISHGMMTLFKQSSGYQNVLYNCTMYKQKWGQYHKLVSYYLDCLTIYKRNCSGTNIMQCYSSKAVKVFMITRPWFPMNMISIRLSLAIFNIVILPWCWIPYKRYGGQFMGHTDHWGATQVEAKLLYTYREVMPHQSGPCTHQADTVWTNMT